MKKFLIKYWTKYKNLNILEQIAFGIGLSLVLLTMFLEIILESTKSVFYAVLWALLIPVFFIIFIFAIWGWNTLIFKILGYRKDTKAPKWLKIISWVVFILIILNLIRRVLIH